MKRTHLIPLTLGCLGLLGNLAYACPTGTITSRTLVAGESGESIGGLQIGGGIDLAMCEQDYGALTPYGFVAKGPQLTVQVPADNPTLRVVGQAEACDGVMLVSNPDGSFGFNDDFFGLNPGISIPANAPGDYTIWYGTYGEGQGCEAAVSIEENLCPTGAEAADVSVGVTQGSMGGLQPILTTAGGTQPLRACANVRDVVGSGFISQAPNVAFDIDAGLNTAILGAAECDTVLLVHAPDGTWLYNDDFDGTNPGLMLPANLPGTYRAWLGTYGSDACSGQIFLADAAEMDAFETDPFEPGPEENETSCGLSQGPAIQNLGFSARQLEDGQRVELRVGGSLNMTECGIGDGIPYNYFAGGQTSADAAIDLELPSGLTQNVSLRLANGVGCDTTLLIQFPSGGFAYSDDVDGTLPALDLPQGEGGIYRIWTGLWGFSSDTPTCESVLEIGLGQDYGEDMPSEPMIAGPDQPGAPMADTGQDPAATTGTACPNVALSGNELQLLAEPTLLESGVVSALTAGGATAIETCNLPVGTNASGSFASAPNFEFNLALSGTTDLVFEAFGTCDTPLLIVTGGGRWIYDDTSALGGQITVPNAASGVYKVWVGAKDAQECPAGLSVQMNG